MQYHVIMLPLSQNALSLLEKDFFMFCICLVQFTTKLLIQMGVFYSGFCYRGIVEVLICTNKMRCSHKRERGEKIKTVLFYSKYLKFKSNGLYVHIAPNYKLNSSKVICWLLLLRISDCIEAWHTPKLH